MRYNPELMQNMLSIGMFGTLGYETIFEHGFVEVLFDAKIIGRGTKVCTLYLLDGSTIIDHAFVSRNVSHSIVELWALWVWRLLMT
jgi:hypothetical protein